MKRRLSLEMLRAVFFGTLLVGLPLLLVTSCLAAVLGDWDSARDLSLLALIDLCALAAVCPT